jgi:hypothetical protein
MNYEDEIGKMLQEAMKPVFVVIEQAQINAQNALNLCKTQAKALTLVTKAIIKVRVLCAEALEESDDLAVTALLDEIHETLIIDLGD